MKKILIIATVAAIATNTNSGLNEKLEEAWGAIGSWCNDHAHTLNTAHPWGKLKTQALCKKAEEYKDPTNTTGYPWKVRYVDGKRLAPDGITCLRCSTSSEEEINITNSFSGTLDETNASKFSPNKKYYMRKNSDKKFECEYGMEKYTCKEINPKKCGWIDFGGICDYPVCLGTAIPLAAGGALLDLGVDGVGPMGRWAKKNPKLAASLRAITDILNDVQKFGTSSDWRGDHFLHRNAKNQGLAAILITMTILKSVTQGFWDARRLEAGEARKFGEKRKAAIVLFDMLSRTCQIWKQKKTKIEHLNVRTDSESAISIHCFVEPLLSGVANLLRANLNSWEQTTNFYFTIGRPLVALYILLYGEL
ncbi:hypothetical protein HOD08_01835 [bacterium]|nr:hypothetical protein [bacterium]